MSLEILQEKINSNADAELRSRISEKLKPLHAELNQFFKDETIEFDVQEVGQTAQLTRVHARPSDLVAMLGAAAFEKGKAASRIRATQRFLDLVEKSGVTL